MKSIGWIKICKTTGKAHTRLYKTEGLAYGYSKGYRQTNEDVAKRWDIKEVFVNEA